MYPQNYNWNDVTLTLIQELTYGKLIIKKVNTKEYVNVVQSILITVVHT